MNTVQIISLVLMIVGGLLALTGPLAVIGIPLAILGFAILVFDALVGGVVNLGLLATGRHQVQGDGNASVGPDGNIYSGMERDSVAARSFTYYDFDVPEVDNGKAVAELDITTFDGGTVNVICTTQSERGKFTGDGDIRILENLSEYDVSSSKISGLLSPGSWSIIIDNTGGISDVAGTDSVDMEMSYTIRE